MLNTIILSFPMALTWMALVQNYTPEGFLVGYVFGFGVLLLVRLNTRFDRDEHPIRLQKVPSQVVWLLIYTVRLTWDVLLSGVDVAQRVMRPTMKINPGMHCISTQDETNTALISAMSAHAITITPGELVIDFDECGEATMLVHTIDAQRSDEEKLAADQANRLTFIKRILGRDE